jgi:hypothetical protein
MGKAATPASTKARFPATGIYPFNPSIAPAMRLLKVL